MRRLSTILIMLVTCSALGQTNAVVEPPHCGPPPPVLDAGQTWADWTNSVHYRVRVIRYSNPPVTNIYMRSVADNTNAPDYNPDVVHEFSRQGVKAKIVAPPPSTFTFKTPVQHSYDLRTWRWQMYDVTVPATANAEFFRVYQPTNGIGR